MENFCRFVKWPQFKVKVKKRRIDFYVIVFAHACLDSATEENKIQEILTISLESLFYHLCCWNKLVHNEVFPNLLHVAMCFASKRNTKLKQSFNSA